MESLDTIFPQNKVEEISNEILKKSIKNITDNLSDNFYNTMSMYLYEHYENNKDKIIQQLVNEFSDKFISDPNNYKYRSFRDKLLEEHKDKIIQSLTEPIIISNIEYCLGMLTDPKYVFSFQWNEYIAKFIINNISLFENDNHVQSVMIKSISALKQQIMDLQNQLYKSP